jgi:hypothetical protein
MLPLVGIATAILPDLIKLIAGDTAGTVAKDVSAAVKTATSTDDPVQAKQKIQADPAVAADLQAKLAQIALDATKAQNAEQAQKRADELTELKNRLADVQAARSNLVDLARLNSPLANVPPKVSYITMIGFFVVLTVLVIDGVLPAGYTSDLSKNQLVNICIGALVAAFSTVINFWLGSSKGSQDKDAANLQLQNAQNQQTADVIKTQAAQTSEALKTAAKVATTPSDGKSGAQAADNFNACVTFTLGQEGGFGNDPQDPGHATNFGITIADLKEWRHDPNLTDEDVRNMKKEEAIEIYRTKYWNAMRCADMPKGVDLAVFDFGVNSGNSRAVKFTQRITGVKDDGSIGPVTTAAINAMDPHELVRRLCADRLSFLQGLPTFGHFGNGWTRRVNEVEQTASKMIV